MPPVVEVEFAPAGAAAGSRMWKHEAGREASGIMTEPMKSADIKSSSYRETFGPPPRGICEEKARAGEYIRFRFLPL